MIGIRRLTGRITTWLNWQEWWCVTDNTCSCHSSVSTKQHTSVQCWYGTLGKGETYYRHGQDTTWIAIATPSTCTHSNIANKINNGGRLVFHVVDIVTDVRYNMRYHQYRIYEHGVCYREILLAWLFKPSTMMGHRQLLTMEIQNNMYCTKLH